MRPSACAPSPLAAFEATLDTAHLSTDPRSRSTTRMSLRSPQTPALGPQAPHLPRNIFTHLRTLDALLRLRVMTTSLMLRPPDESVRLRTTTSRSLSLHDERVRQRTTTTRATRTRTRDTLVPPTMTIMGLASTNAQNAPII